MMFDAWFRAPRGRLPGRIRIAGLWIAVLAAVPTVRAHPGHDDGAHVDPIYTLLLVAGLCVLGGSFLLLTRDETDRSRWGSVLALVGVGLTAIGASAWL